MLRSLSIFLVAALYTQIPGVLSAAPSGPWDAFNFAPSSRTVKPVSIFKSEGSVENGKALTDAGSGKTTFNSGSWLALDFGKEVGGLISMNIDSVANSSAFALSFSESPMFVSPTTSDDSSFPSANMSYDGVLEVQSPLEEGFWTQPADRLRGGFRFLTVVSKSTDSFTISNITCSISFMPQTEDLRDYAGYFYAQDPSFHDKDFLTKIWYAGAYTVQTNTVPLNTGRAVPFVSSPGWENNATLGVAGPIIVDGAKRDRAVWPGDMGIAVPTQFVSTNDLLPTRNALSTMFAAINPTTGALPESGPPLSQQGSDTYHAWTLIGTHNYYLYSGDTDWLQGIWANYTKAVQFLENKVTASGLMNVTGLRDWARLGQGGLNAEGNALLYRVLITAADLASHLNESTLQEAWTVNSTSLKAKYNEAFWVPELGMYRDNETTTLCPQDANSFAILFNLTTSSNQSASISEGLQKNWNDLGPVAPELPDTISPFISGFELQAHFLSGNDARAMDLLQREWGYMLYTNLSVQSTLLEGFAANGSIGYRSYDGYNYDASYTSHSHGWSSGPTSALTIYVLGLQVTSPMGQTWTLKPHTSGLPAAEGGFQTPLGWFGVKWTSTSKLFSLTVTTPSGTQGIVTVPGDKSIQLDGRSIELYGSRQLTVGGGTHVITAN